VQHYDKNTQTRRRSIEAHEFTARRLRRLINKPLYRGFLLCYGVVTFMAMRASQWQALKKVRVVKLAALRRNSDA